jgi:RND superfamily putative drug exporter
MIDTFLVRTLLVPCVMLTLKDKNWWPRKVVPVNPEADAAYDAATSGSSSWGPQGAAAGRRMGWSHLPSGY